MPTTDIEPHCIIVRAENLPSSRIQDDMIAVDERAGRYYAMNFSAARIWELIGQPQSVAVLYQQLGREFAMDEETCFDEVVKFLTAMRDNGLIKVC